ncbi:MAG: hypothetical protein Unbinned4512contig1001_50 [Prokaryotic dsDNA virus sp.]|nr:MAG: hypothetical protein Unbinned4512contig1001_50 [Prokaryotic dsDNA virus sp.]|tara:strand:+ start:5209 stop:5391 length:183 start_codon:yes stop_codon:yes gene_type:complete
MKTIKSCPECNRILEPVTNAEGDMLGYFCKNVLNGSCNYINVKSLTEHNFEKTRNKKHFD